MSVHPAVWAAAAAVLLALGGYAAVLLVRLRRQRRREQHRRRAAEEARAGRDAQARVSIALLAQAMGQGQVSRTEAAIRISALARSLPLTEAERAVYRPFDELAAAAAHIPILDAWRELPRRSQNRFDAERRALERAHAEGLDAAVAELAASLSVRPPA